MKSKPKREIKFVVTGEEIQLLMQVNEQFLEEFSGRDLRGTRHEFTYSYEALYQLGFDVTGAACFTVPPKLKPQFNRLAKKINLLLKLSDSLSQAARNHTSMVIIFLMLVMTGTAGITISQAVAEVSAVASYEQLLAAIRQAKAESRSRIEAMVEEEKVREAWEIGKLIETHILHNKPRADYDKQVVEQLAKDLDSSPTEIWYMLEFARAYPILPQAGELSWAHYRELLSLNDFKEREEVARRAVRENWGRDRVREEVRRRQAAARPAERKEPARAILTAAPGKPGMYRVVKTYYGKQPNQLVLDLGFSSYYRPPGKFPFKEGDIVQWNSDVGAGPSARPSQGAHTAEQCRGAACRSAGRRAPLQKMPNATPSDLFTYAAAVIKVIDGDTFTAAVRLGFGFTTVQTLRLRALDAPEIESAEGHEAKEFLEHELGLPSLRGSSQNEAEAISERRLLRRPPSDQWWAPRNDKQILIRTHQSDKYDRYLADVFVNGEYVNQKLVDEGFAVPLTE